MARRTIFSRWAAARSRFSGMAQRGPLPGMYDPSGPDPTVVSTYRALGQMPGR
ncbi:hypothetical protein AB0G54_22325 [Streptomyces yokosukanensis]|uniref:hypothetical protein n=1 Tax=Streptomyces yokosukanensis TaxID=67386 RepID=UPI00131E2948|nr:hypothetical protein [Streptomyces yokosukanensis]